MHIVFISCTRFDHLQSLGKRLSSSLRGSGEVGERMKQLGQERVTLREAWEGRNKQLKQSSELQLFLRDAEQVDAATSGHEAFLSNDDLGVSQRVGEVLHSWIEVCFLVMPDSVFFHNYCNNFPIIARTYTHTHCICIHTHTYIQTSVDSVEVLLKKHEDFESTSVAHDDRIRTLSEQANKLIHAGHYDTARLAATALVCRANQHQKRYFLSYILLHSYIVYICSPAVPGLPI